MYKQIQLKLIKQMGPSYLKQIECDETMVNWISAFKDCRKTDIKGFARVAGDRKVCIPANSVNIINVIGPSQKLSVEKTKTRYVVPLTTRNIFDYQYTSIFDCLVNGRYKYVSFYISNVRDLQTICCSKL
jgi:hypothetical protein